MMPDMEGIADYAKSLVTVEIAIFVMETEDGLRVSLRSKGADVSIIAKEFGGGGHSVAAGFTLTQRDLHAIIDIILKMIQKAGLIHGKK
jgi:phosphoesterase RecJ-like protein